MLHLTVCSLCALFVINFTDGIDAKTEVPSEESIYAYAYDLRMSGRFWLPHVFGWVGLG